MTTEQAEALESYARSLDLSRPAVLVLLVHRELRVPRLDELRRARELYPNDKSGTRVTIRIDESSRKAAFAAHARSLRVGSDEAAWLLFSDELEEHWVEKELAWTA